MDHLPTLADRLRDAMGDAISASDLARACGVSPTAVGKWLAGGKMSADNLACAARALGVREEWLRTGRLPRDREHAADERDMDTVIQSLVQMREPLVALLGAIDRLTSNRATGTAKRKRKGE